MLASPVTVYGSLPQVWDFMFGADRITVEPEVATTYAGQNAMRFCLRSPGDGRRLYVFADPMTLRPLTVVAE